MNLHHNSFVQRLNECVAIFGSRRKFAQKAGVNETTIMGYFRDREPPRPTLVALARAAGVNLLWLATGEGPKFPQKEPPAPKAPEIAPALAAAFRPVSQLIDQLTALGLIDGDGMAQRLAKAMAAHLCQEAAGRAGSPDTAPHSPMAPLSPMRRAWRAAAALAAKHGGEAADYMKDGSLLAAAHAQSPKPKGDRS